MMEYQDEVRSIWSSGVKHASAAEQGHQRWRENFVSASSSSSQSRIKVLRLELQLEPAELLLTLRIQTKVWDLS